MASAKINFITRINTFESIIYPNLPNDINLNSRALTETLHNEKVRMLRNGMSIIGFTILEDFIKRSIGEILKNIGSTGCNFNLLPEKLKEAEILLTEKMDIKELYLMTPFQRIFKTELK